MANHRTSVVIVDVVGNSERETGVMDTVHGQYIAAIDWSPDGTAIAVAFTLNDADPMRAEVFAIDPTDGSSRQLTDQNWSMIRSVAWAKDADAIVVAAGEGTAGDDRTIWLVPFPKGQPRRLLADSAVYSSLDIANDNAMLAVQSMAYTNIC